MIKKLTYLLACLLTAFAVQAQTIAPLGDGLPYAPEKVVSFGDGLVAIYLDQNEEIQVEVWNGDFWTKLPAPEIPAIGNTAYGLLKFKDIAVFSNRIYVLAEHVVDITNDAPNYLLAWNGTSWEDASDDDIQNAVTLNYLVVQNDEFLCVGVFSGSDRNYNVATLNGTDWELEGNLITRLNGDNIEDIAVSKDKIYVTGTFSDPALGKSSLAEWNGTYWQQTPYPPFLGKNEVVGNYNNSVVVYGQGTFTDEKVKLKSGTSWEDISNGLDAFIINHVNGFEEANGALYMIGDFADINSNTPLNILEFKNGDWHSMALSSEPITNLAVVSGNLVIAGRFHDDVKVNFVGQVIPFAQVKAGVYEDLNGNCVHDEGEEWVNYYPIHFTPGLELMTDKSGQLYFPVQQDTYTINASSAFYYEPTCPDLEIEIDEYKVYTDIEFGIKKQSGIKDITTSLTDNQSYYHQVGETKKILVCASNVGSEPVQDAELVISHDDKVINLTSSEIPYISYEDQKATWLLNIEADEQVCFYIEVTTISNSDISIAANIELQNPEEDKNTFNNSTEIRYKKGTTLVNEKYSSNGYYISEDEDQIHYKVGFKNVTNETVKTVRIVDQFDPLINPSTVSSKGVIYTTSHSDKVSLSVHTELDPNTNEYTIKCQWVFTDINIPASYLDDENSQGFVDFVVNIRPNAFKAGEEICNTAYIYLIPETNYAPEPLKTNTVCSEVDDKSDVPEPPQPIEGITVGPNPASSDIEVNNSTGTDYTLVLTNTIGQTVMEFVVMQNSTTTVSIEGLEPGVYFIRSEQQLVTKLIVR